MSEPNERGENFLQRWSRRKQAAETRAHDGSEPQPSANAEADAPIGAATPSKPDRSVFDPATLPPIESITAASDIGAFLAPGVPEELSRAALRRAWLTDPTIRDFIGLAENQWDFTQPESVPGFGSLQVTPELRRMVARLVGDAPATIAPPPDAGRGDQTIEKPAEQPPAATGQSSAETAARVGQALTQGKPQTSESVASDALSVRRPAHTIDAALQPNLGNPAETSESAHRRHGGALPE